MKKVVVTIILLSLPTMLFAHHSVNFYEEAVTRVAGELVEVQWRTEGAALSRQQNEPLIPQPRRKAEALIPHFVQADNIGPVQGAEVQQSMYRKCMRRLEPWSSSGDRDP